MRRWVYNGAGLIRVALPEGSFLKLSTVISLHRTNPELFAWCDTVYDRSSRCCDREAGRCPASRV